jgi:hypothetical protein
MDYLKATPERSKIYEKYEDYDNKGITISPHVKNDPNISRLVTRVGDNVSYSPNAYKEYGMHTTSHPEGQRGISEVVFWKNKFIF